MPLLLIVVVSFFVFILGLIGAQCCYFSRRWMLFWVAVVCVVISGGCVFDELYQWIEPPQREPTLTLRPVIPL